MARPHGESTLLLRGASTLLLRGASRRPPRRASQSRLRGLRGRGRSERVGTPRLPPPPYCCPYPCPYCTLTHSLPTVAPTRVPTVHSLCRHPAGGLRPALCSTQPPPPYCSPYRAPYCSGDRLIESTRPRRRSATAGRFNTFPIPPPGVASLRGEMCVRRCASELYRSGVCAPRSRRR